MDETRLVRRKIGVRITVASLMAMAATRDYRERKRVEDDLRFLNGELAHRLKNVLAVVQSVAQQTLRSATDTKSAAEALGSRLVALGGATDALTAGAWRSAVLSV